MRALALLFALAMAVAGGLMIAHGLADLVRVFKQVATQ